MAGAGRSSNSQSCHMSDCARNLSGGAEVRWVMREAFGVSTGPSSGKCLRSEESSEGFIQRRRGASPFLPSGASQAGTPHSSTAGSGQLWATTHSAAQCSKCCTLAPSKKYLKADNPPANHQRYLFSQVIYKQDIPDYWTPGYFVRNVNRAMVA